MWWFCLNSAEGIEPSWRTTKCGIQNACIDWFFFSLWTRDLPLTRLELTRRLYESTVLNLLNVDEVRVLVSITYGRLVRVDIPQNVGTENKYWLVFSFHCGRAIYEWLGRSSPDDCWRVEISNQENVGRGVFWFRLPMDERVIFVWIEGAWWWLWSARLLWLKWLFGWGVVELVIGAYRPRRSWRCKIVPRSFYLQVWS
jgi:hypothetical protein